MRAGEITSERMSYPSRTPVHHHGNTDAPISNQTNQQFQHHYSELLQLNTDSDGSATYTMPAYPSSDGSHATYSTTAPLYHNPNCQCHLHPSQPAQCISPAHQTAQSTDSSSDATTSSCTKDVWVADKRKVTKVNRLNQPIAWIWTGLSVLIFSICTLTLTQTSWLVHSNGESLGLVKQCKLTAKELECRYYPQLSSLKLPSVSWRLTLIFFCIADTLLGLSSLLALGTTLLSQIKTRRYISFFAGYVQLFSAILFTTSVLFYMVGLDSHVVRDICGDSSVFQTGSCEIGWSYLLLIITTSLCYVLPVLSHYTDNTLCSRCEKPEPPEYVA